MSARNTLIAKIHIAKKDLGLDDDTYRGALEMATGKSSCSKMTDRQLQDTLAHFKTKGFQPKKAGTFKPASKNGDVRLIYALWWDLHHAADIVRDVKKERIVP